MVSWGGGGYGWGVVGEGGWLWGWRRVGSRRTVWAQDINYIAQWRWRKNILSGRRVNLCRCRCTCYTHTVQSQSFSLRVSESGTVGLIRESLSKFLLLFRADLDRKLVTVWVTVVVSCPPWPQAEKLVPFIHLSSIVVIDLRVTLY
jgi:hypothetical protein